MINWSKIMKKIFSRFTITALLACSLFGTSAAYAAPVEEVEKSYDFNKDGKINGFDWVMMSGSQKQELISAYYTSGYKSLLVTMSSTNKNREIYRVVSRLNYYYSGVNSENK